MNFWGRNLKNLSSELESVPTRHHEQQFSVKTDNLEFFSLNLGKLPRYVQILVLITLRVLLKSHSGETSYLDGMIIFIETDPRVEFRIFIKCAINCNRLMVILRSYLTHKVLLCNWNLSFTCAMWEKVHLISYSVGLIHIFRYSIDIIRLLVFDIDMFML